MAFAWDDLLRFAERLTASNEDEVAQRTAINRAYYAAYHAAASHVRSRGLLVAGHTHQRVWAALSERGDRDEAGLGRRGDRLRQTRIGADYRNPFPGRLDERTRAAVAEARDVIEAFRQVR